MTKPPHSCPEIATVVERAIREFCRKSPGFPDLSLTAMAKDVADAVARHGAPAQAPTIGAHDVKIRIDGSWVCLTCGAVSETGFAHSSTEGKTR